MRKPLIKNAFRCISSEMCPYVAGSFRVRKGRVRVRARILLLSRVQCIADSAVV